MCNVTTSTSDQSGDGERRGHLKKMAGICQIRSLQSVISKLRVTPRKEHSQGHTAGPVVGLPHLRARRRAGGITPRGTLPTCTATGDSEPQIQAVLADSKVALRNLGAQAKDVPEDIRYATRTF